MRPGLARFSNSKVRTTHTGTPCCCLQEPEAAYAHTTRYLLRPPLECRAQQILAARGACIDSAESRAGEHGAHSCLQFARNSRGLLLSKLVIIRGTSTNLETPVVTALPLSLTIPIDLYNLWREGGREQLSQRKSHGERQGKALLPCFVQALVGHWMMAVLAPTPGLMHPADAPAGLAGLPKGAAWSCQPTWTMWPCHQSKA